MRVALPSKPSLRIAALYALFGSLWIVFSDRIAAAVVSDAGTLVLVHTLKGWFFIAVTAALLYHVIARQLARTAEATAAKAAAEAARAHAESQQALAREAASAAAHRLLLASKAANLGTWEWEIANGRIQCDEQMHFLYRVKPGERPATFAAWTDLLHPGDQERIQKQVQAALDGRQEYHTQFRVLWSDGQVRHIEAHALVLRDHAGRPQRMIGVNWDITERVIAEQRYRMLAEHAGDVLWIIDLGTRCYTYVSPAIVRLRGSLPEELVGRPLEHGLTPASIALIHQLLPARLEAFLRGDPAAVTQNHEIEHLRTDGTTARSEIVTTFLHNDRGGIDVVGITRDISRRHAAEVALQRSTTRLRHAEEIAGIGHWALNLDTATVEASPNAAKIYGIPPAAQWSLALVRSFPLPEYRKPLEDALHALVAGERAYDIIYKIRQPDSGALVTIHSRAEYDAENRTVFGTIQDITGRENTLAELRASEGKLRLLVSNAPVVLFQIGADGLFRMSEGAGLAQLGLRPGQIVGQSVFDVYRDHPRICEQVRSALAGHTIHDLTRIGATWFEVFYNPMKGDDGTITDLIGLAIDVTERKRAEARLRLESAALAAAAHAIAITDARGTIEWINPAFTTLTGYTADEAVGRDLGKLVQSGQQTAENYQQLWTTILSGKTWRGELVNRHKDGSLVAEEETITPVRGEDGRIGHFIAIKQDITERRRLKEQALRAQRLDSVGRLAGGIAHDLNNILAPVLMAPSVLRENVTDHSAHEILDAIEISANRGAAIIRQLLTFSRGGGGERAPVQLRHIIRDMAVIIRETFPKNIATRTDLHSASWLVQADATQLHQVLMNLCVNSRDAMPDGGTLTISLENVELDDVAVAGHPGASAGPHVILGVFDTGTGIAPEHLDKVFDPFFSTKAVGKGTGLGLATVLGIIRDHHGFVEIASHSGRGTHVRVYLPAVPAAPPAESATDERSLPPRGRGELVLLVDDEENVRRISRRILENHGYRIILANDGAEALARFQQHRATIRLVITDVIMPFMDGIALIRAIRQIDPSVPLVAVSGHAAESPQIDVEVTAFLAKPYLRSTLLETVAAALPPA